MGEGSDLNQKGQIPEAGAMSVFDHFNQSTPEVLLTGKTNVRNEFSFVRLLLFKIHVWGKLY